MATTTKAEPPRESGSKYTSGSMEPRSRYARARTARGVQYLLFVRLSPWCSVGKRAETIRPKHISMWAGGLDLELSFAGTRARRLGVRVNFLGAFLFVGPASTPQSWPCLACAVRTCTALGKGSCLHVLAILAHLHIITSHRH